MQCVDLWENDDFVFGYEVVADQVDRDFLVGGDYHIGLLESYPQCMMMIMALEPIVGMFPIAQKAEILNFHNSSSVLIGVLLHAVLGLTYKSSKFVQLYAYEKTNPFILSPSVAVYTLGPDCRPQHGHRYSCFEKQHHAGVQISL